MRSLLGVSNNVSEGRGASGTDRGGVGGGDDHFLTRDGHVDGKDDPSQRATWEVELLEASDNAARSFNRGDTNGEEMAIGLALGEDHLDIGWADGRHAG